MAHMVEHLLSNSEILSSSPNATHQKKYILDHKNVGININKRHTKNMGG
jgi:hypothetical protein